VTVDRFSLELVALATQISVAATRWDPGQNRKGLRLAKVSFKPAIVVLVAAVLIWV